jgi:hypothetical protein
MAATEQLVRIDQNGNVTFLFHDGSPVQNVGEDLQVVRASNVRFDNGSKRWAVYLRFPDGGEERLPETFEKRADAIAYEIEICEGLLAIQPELVAGMFQTGTVLDSDGRPTSG